MWASEQPALFRTPQGSIVLVKTKRFMLYLHVLRSVLSVHVCVCVCVCVYVMYTCMYVRGNRERRRM